jgi:hypothetical protein
VVELGEVELPDYGLTAGAADRRLRVARLARWLRVARLTRVAAGGTGLS